MPRGDRSAYTDKQKRMAGHIEASCESQGMPEERAASARRAAATRKRNAAGKNA